MSEPTKKYRIDVINFDLSIARNNVSFGSGVWNALKVSSISNLNANVKIKFDSESDILIPVQPGESFGFENKAGGEQPSFGRVFVSNDAVPGSATLIFSNNVEILKQLRITTDLVQVGILQAAILVTDVAQPLPAVSLQDRINLIINNIGANTIYLGNSAVTSANGFPVASTEVFALTVSQSVPVYAVCAALNTSAIRILEGA